MMQALQPDIRTLGMLASSTETSGSESAAAVAVLAEELGLAVEQVAMVDQADARAAINGLFNRNIDAVVLSLDSLTAQNLPLISAMALDYGIPVYAPALPSIIFGATFFAGFLSEDLEAVAVARLLASYLAGQLNPASTGLLELTGAGIGVNMDAAASMGMEVPPGILDEADLVLSDENLAPSRRYQEQLLAGDPTIPVAQDSEADAALVDSLHCTAEMIARQRAALDESS